MHKGGGSMKLQITNVWIKYLEIGNEFGRGAGWKI